MRQGLDETEILSKLPDSLRRQLYISLNKKLFTNMPLFKFCDVQCILALVDRLKPCIFMPGDFVIRQGTFAQARAAAPLQRFTLAHETA